MLQLPCLEKADIQDCENFYEKLLYLLIQMKTGMKTIEELKQEECFGIAKLGFESKT